MSDKPASEAQRSYLESLTAPERLAALSSAEARFLIRFLRSPPQNCSRAQQLYLADLLERLPRERLRNLIAKLAELEQGGKPAVPPAPAPAPPRWVPPEEHRPRQSMSPPVDEDLGEVF